MKGALDSSERGVVLPFRKLTDSNEKMVGFGEFLFSLQVLAEMKESKAKTCPHCRKKMEPNLLVCNDCYSKYGKRIADAVKKAFNESEINFQFSNKNKAHTTTVKETEKNTKEILFRKVLEIVKEKDNKKKSPYELANIVVLERIVINGVAENISFKMAIAAVHMNRGTYRKKS